MLTTNAREVSADLRGIPSRLQPQVGRVIERGAWAIKNDLQKQMSSSSYFKGLSRSISYDVEITSGGYRAEIGPVSDAGSPGNLANIAYFGSSRGGGTVEDPVLAGVRELPHLEAHLGQLVDRV